MYMLIGQWWLTTGGAQVAVYTVVPTSLGQDRTFPPCNSILCQIADSSYTLDDKE